MCRSSRARHFECSPGLLCYLNVFVVFSCLSVTWSVDEIGAPSKRVLNKSEQNLTDFKRNPKQASKTLIKTLNNHPYQLVSTQHPLAQGNTFFFLLVFIVLS